MLNVRIPAINRQLDSAMTTWKLLVLGGGWCCYPTAAAIDFSNIIMSGTSHATDLFLSGLDGTEDEKDGRICRQRCVCSGLYVGW